MTLVSIGEVASRHGAEIAAVERLVTTGALPARITIRREWWVDQDAADMLLTRALPAHEAQSTVRDRQLQPDPVLKSARALWRLLREKGYPWSYRFVLSLIHADVFTPIAAGKRKRFRTSQVLDDLQRWHRRSTHRARED